MNLDTLRRLTGWSQKIAAAQQQLAEELAAELARTEPIHDPLAVHIYKARASFRRTTERDKSKHGRQIEMTLRTSYREAEQVGFRAPYDFWCLLMRCGTANAAPTPAVPSIPTPHSPETPPGS